MNQSSSQGPVALAVFVAVGLIVILLVAAAAGVLWFRQVRQTQHQLVVAELREAEVRAQAARLESIRSNVDAAATVADEDMGAIESAVRSVLQLQQLAWNDGDIETFMQGYWNSPLLTFSSRGQVTRSWGDTLQNYHTRYPTRDAMGKLSFENLEVTPLGSTAAMVLGEWRLQRNDETLAGNFTLVFRRIDGDWRIVHDHTSRAQQP